LILNDIADVNIQLAVQTRNISIWDTDLSVLL